MPYILSTYWFARIIDQEKVKKNKSFWVSLELGPPFSPSSEPLLANAGKNPSQATEREDWWGSDER